MITSFYLHSLRYMTPFVKYKLSYNRARNFVPKNEAFYIYEDAAILLGLQLVVLPGILIVVLGSMFNYSIKSSLFILMILAFLIAFIIIYIAKKRCYYISLLREAEEMTLDEHRARKKELLPTSFLRYMLPTILMIGVCILSNYIR